MQNYKEMAQARHNAEYLVKIDENLKNHKKGDIISFTMEELKAMEANDWKPTKIVLEFEQKHDIQRTKKSQ